MCAAPDGRYGRPNCVVRSDGGDLVIQGQKSAWVSNGPIAQLCLLYAAYDDGSSAIQNCTVLVPLDAKGVSRGKPLDKLGQRALPQGELFFDGVRVPRDHLLAAPGPAYDLAMHIVLSEANAGMCSLDVIRVHVQLLASSEAHRPTGVELASGLNSTTKGASIVRTEPTSEVLSRGGSAASDRVPKSRNRTQ